MKKVRCSKCGIVTSNFIRYNKEKVLCLKCFFTLYNYCSGCGTIYSYYDLKEVYSSEGLEYYCRECEEMILEKCDFCGKYILKGENLYLAEDGSNEIHPLCEKCFNFFNRR